MEVRVGALPLLLFMLQRISAMTFAPPRNIVVVGGGIQGASVAYHLSKSKSLPPDAKITVLESQEIASAASGKGGGFMARSWGDGSVTQRLHELAFDMYETLSEELECTTYRKLPVLSVSPGRSNQGVKQALKSSNLKQYMPSWLDGNTGNINVLGRGNDTAQITPSEFTQKLIEASKAQVIIGKCTGVESSIDDDDFTVKSVNYVTKDGTAGNIVCDAIVVSAGPWSCQAEDWFKESGVQLPMEGVKSTSIVWKCKENVDATALFCGEDSRFGTHLEVYPRPDGSIYLCGIGGSNYIPTDELKEGAFNEVCEANPSRVDAASSAFKEISASYRGEELEKVQACMRPCPPDALPYMGKIPNFQGAYINAGHNCWGIAWAPASGLALAELVLEGASTSIDLTYFSPSRFTKRAEKRGRKKRGVNVGEQW